MEVPPKNRVLELVHSTTLNGIDYVEVREAEPTRLYVHFFNAVPIDQPGLRATITGGDRTPEVVVEPIQAADLLTDSEGRLVLRLRVPGRGDFSMYRLALEGGRNLDPYFRSIAFSFYAFCPSKVDCRKPEDFCAVEGTLPPIDYLAKDFDSFRQALSDFSAQRFPEWRERAEADLGMVMMEALSAIGDDLSYLQDSVHRQAALETATERRAIVRLARLVDYEPRPLTSATALLQCGVTASQLPAGVLVYGQAPDGSTVPFETGAGLSDTTMYRVSPQWNDAIHPYWFDDRDRCLQPGATSMYVAEHGFGFPAGIQLLIDTKGATNADPRIRQVVTLSSAGVEETDPVFAKNVTRIEWRAEDALVHHHDLRVTEVLGNLVPATQGQRHVEHFAIEKAPVSDAGMPLAIARLGANSTADAPVWQYRYTLRNGPLSFLEGSGGTIAPEIQVTLLSAVRKEWEWVDTLLDADQFEEKFTVEPASWRRTMQTPGGTAYDYEGSDGSTICFGDGVFGELPNDSDVFEVRYRVSRGLEGNLAPGAIRSVDPAWAGILTSVTNPFAATGGEGAETDEQVRRRAPNAFRTIAYRAVRPEDYNAAAERLEFVQRAGTVFRWTGSWPTIFTTADPVSAGAVTRSQHIELVGMLNRVRLAGYETYAPRPRYVSFDLEIVICAKPGAFQGDVYAGVYRALDPVRYPDGTVGFFHFDNFTLGTPFERSRLEAAIQAVPTVGGVLSIRYRRRGHLNTFVNLPGTVPFAPGEIFRLDNDANRPERGSYRIRVEGGK